MQLGVSALGYNGCGGVVWHLVRGSVRARETITWIAGEEHPEKVVKELGRVVDLHMPLRHHISPEDVRPRHLHKVLRALSLLSELLYDAPSGLRDPAIFSFSHGGKDGYPYPVDRKTYDETIGFLSTALERARVGDREKMEAFRRLYRMWNGS